MKIIKKEVTSVKLDVKGEMEKSYSVADFTVGVRLDKKIINICGLKIIIELNTDSQNGSSFDFEVSQYVLLEFDYNRPNATDLFEIVKTAFDDASKILIGEATQKKIYKVPPKPQLNEKKILEALESEIAEVYP